MAAEGYHEPYERLTTPTTDMHRAIRSLMEELEAVDWYQQRVNACQDNDLRDILGHNRDEEKEHASMVLEWIRRRDPAFDEYLKKYLFSTGSITGQEEETKAAEGRGNMTSQPSIGSLRGTGGNKK